YCMNLQRSLRHLSLTLAFGFSLSGPSLALETLPGTSLFLPTLSPASSAATARTVGRTTGNQLKSAQANPTPHTYRDPGWQPVKPTDAIDQPMRIEIRLKERKAFLFRGNTQVKSYWIAYGRPGWETPVGQFKVMQKIHKPTWIHPMTGEAVPGGDPDNPLGKHWIGFWTDGTNWIGFHGTPNPETVGRAASHGCIRMYNQDVEHLFQQVEVGTPVIVTR
ncbi:MAG: L,D-transpeptidase, partial [Leptolyngbyaceae cyanobacterium bins.59]|nr:L,D-transpeptidase [Leptolyngbyaceae cyanobacterium bins.59]